MAITLSAFPGFGRSLMAGERLQRGVANVAGRAASLWAAERRDRDAGRILAALDGLEDRQLASLGLAREELEDFVADAVLGDRQPTARTLGEDAFR